MTSAMGNVGDVYTYRASDVLSLTSHNFVIRTGHDAILKHVRVAHALNT